MNRLFKLLTIVLAFISIFIYTAFADDKIENNPFAEETVTENITDSEATAEVDIDTSDEANKIVDKLATLLDPENDELEKEVTEILEKYSDNWLVKFFKAIIDAISRFLNALFKLASEAAKIGVE